jgi:hypothetical protein
MAGAMLSVKAGVGNNTSGGVGATPCANVTPDSDTQLSQQMPKPMCHGKDFCMSKQSGFKERMRHKQ